MKARTPSWDAIRLVILLGLGAAKALDQQPLTSGSRDAKDPFTDTFRQLVELGLEKWHVAGLAISVVDGNDTFAKGFGFATLPNVPATPETLWYVGSTTKAYTTATLATLIDSQNHSELSLGWKTPISSIIRDDFVLQDTWATQHLTLEDAVSHRTGMTRHDGSSRWDPENPRGIVRDAVRNLRNLPMHIEPRTEFRYCNLFYTVLSHVIETLTGQWLGDVMKEHIWEPLGMNSTYLELEDAKAAPEHLSQGYIWHEDAQALKPLPYVPSGGLNGAGAIISNVLDYSKWMRCLLNEGQPFSEAVHKEIRRPRMVANIGTFAKKPTYSLSWVRATLYGKTVYWHSGSTLTHAALVYWFPDDNYGVTIFVNSVNPLMEMLILRLIEDRFQVPEDERADVEKKAKESEEARRKLIANATNIVYPDRPSTSSPPTLSFSDHAGTYRHAGYGDVTFSVGSHPSRPEDITLVAEQPDRAWGATVRLEHVTGNWWIWFAYIKDGPPEPVWFFKTEFKVGPDGKISSVEVDLYDYDEGLSQGTISYKKVA